MKQLVSSTKRVKAGNSQAAAAARRASSQAYMANGYKATQAAVTSATNACTPIFRGAAPPVTLWESRYRRMSPTHRPRWRTARIAMAHAVYVAEFRPSRQIASEGKSP
jgi:hypothetical protein